MQIQIKPNVLKTGPEGEPLAWTIQSNLVRSRFVPAKAWVKNNKNPKSKKANTLKELLVGPTDTTIGF